MTDKKAVRRLFAVVGTDIGDVHYDAGQEIKGPIPEGIQKYLVKEGYAIEADKLPDDIKAAIDAGTAGPHLIEGHADTKED